MYNGVIVLFRAFFDICLLKRRPQDIPASQALLLIVVTSYLLITFLLAGLDKTSPNTIVVGIMDTASLLVFVFLLLLLHRKLNRWLQTTTALAGTGMIFSIFVLPFMLDRPGPELLSDTVPVSYFAQLLIVMWYILVMAHIFRHAISTSLFSGICISIGYVLLLRLLIELSVAGLIT